MKLKICGMKYPENILEIAKLKPDYLGFIFWRKSSRFFDGTIPNLPKSIHKVGVFVNATVEEILEKVNRYELQIIQLHGNETVTFCDELRSPTDKIDEVQIKIIKAFSIDSEFDFTKLNEYETVCDYFLFDTKGKLPGGNGTAFDWNLLTKYNLSKPYFLSGGIGLQEITNIKEFITSDISKNCIAIDVNSKFEIQPALKNEKELSQFKKLLNEN
jgi:phosphoribosylanthranilate isomerase